MAKQFEVEWDDFLGGYYVGRSDVKQPKNTWTGKDIGITPDKGYLIPLPFAEARVSSEAALATPGYAVGAATFNGPVYGYGTNLYYSTWAGATNTVATGGYTINQATTASVVMFDNYLMFATTTTKIVAFHTSTFALTAVNIPGTFNAIGTYKDWVVGSVGGRMYFSSPAAPLTAWSSNDYIDVARVGGGQIYKFLDTLDALYVFTTVGTFAVTGVLGQTASLRQINRVVVHNGLTAGGQIITQVGPTTNKMLGVLNGSSVVTTHHTSPDGIDTMASAGTPVIGSTQTYGDVWLYDSLHNAWMFRTQGPGGTTALGPRTTTWDSTQDGAEAYAYVVTDACIYRYKVFPTECDKNTAATVFPSATVTLADYQAKDPFRVTEVFVEIEVGSADTAVRSVGLQLEAVGAAVDYSALPTTFGENVTQTQTHTFTTTAANKRMTIRFKPNDGGEMLSCAPKVTLQGVKLRRVLMRGQMAS